MDDVSEAAGTSALAQLDAARRGLGEPAGHAGVVREWSADGSECRIVFASPADDEIEDVIRAEMALARSGGYVLEWKVYGHDRPALGARLEAAGFEPDDQEQVLVLPVDEAALAAFDLPGYDVREVHDVSELVGYAEIARETGRKNPDEERRRLAASITEHPEAMSVHIAYAEGRPVACGRVHFQPGSPFAELAGGRTRTTHRRRGFFTAVVGSRLRQAARRGCGMLVTDALPTSEPILRNRGFRPLTWTRPYVYEPSP